MRLRGAVQWGLVAAMAIAGGLGASAQTLPGCYETVDPVTGDIRNYCFPDGIPWNGDLVIWAHGFQDATEAVGIPVDQLTFGDVSIPEIVNGLGFAFATNSYRKTGLAIKQGQQDILDMVAEFEDLWGTPGDIYLTGASEGGIITTLLVEKHPDIFRGGGLAACGPIGDFPYQINYFGNGRALFQVFFPGVIPGDPFNPSPALIANWTTYYENVVKPIMLHPNVRGKFDRWVKMAKLPFDAGNYLETAEQSARDVLRYGVVNLNDAKAVLGGMPFDNVGVWYSGAGNFWDDLVVNLAVQRVSSAPAAVVEMGTNNYTTTGNIHQPLVTIHTLRDQQVPYRHEQLYDFKHIASLLSGNSSFLRLNWGIDRYGHCEFTADEALVAFAALLIINNDLPTVIDHLPGLLEDFGYSEQEAAELIALLELVSGVYHLFD